MQAGGSGHWGDGSGCGGVFGVEGVVGKVMMGLGLVEGWVSPIYPLDPFGAAERPHRCARAVPRN